MSDQPIEQVQPGAAAGNGADGLDNPPANPETGAGDPAQAGKVTATVAAQQPAPVASQFDELEVPPAEPGKPLGADAPPLAELQNQLCPNCSTGVLYVTRYDPSAIYEQGQGSALAAGAESGGAYDVGCAACDYTESRAFNPGIAHGGRA